MAEMPEKAVSGPSSTNEAPADWPTGWKYRVRRIGPFTIPHYASPQIQLVIVSLVCFMCPGMFNALGGIGGGGQVDKTAADDANVALYSTFAVVGFFAGSIANVLGVKFALSFGGLGYSIYVASFLSYSHNANKGFTIFAGFFLGLCAGLLWTAQGAIMMSYPPEKSKGRYISFFWMVFNLGAVIGALIPLGQNIHVRTNSTVSDGTYIGFLILTLIGAAMAWLLVDAHSVIRSDGSRVILMKNPTWKTEITGLFQTFRTDPYILFMFPMFFASNFFYTYQFNGFNGAKFTTRTKALNNVLYWMMQIVGAYIFGFALDYQGVRRSVRARVAWIVLMVLTFAIWGGGYAYQRTYTRAETSSKTYAFTDWSDSGYVGPMFLYMFYGFYDAAFQTCVYWYMGSLSNNGRKLANFAGFYKGMQSAGSAISFSLDGIYAISFMSFLGTCWGLLAGGLVLALPLIWFKIKDSVPLTDDLQFSDETVADVAPTHIAHAPTVSKGATLEDATTTEKA
ncbi:MFS general substrate transporter [Microthyrium microscopicum]|uniref:MFS general substrate transporter n=1 Tax=Microthyrium microscopicum TaxID=703497 RepID=A0A6A6UPX7_9PEZI|nr:MFS general substrate transporter [Microthyrium microscopicum]